MSHRLMMMNRHFSSLSQKLIKRSIVIGAFSSIAVLAGWAPNLSAPVAKMFDQSAFAQESAFTRYVRAAIALEQRRLGRATHPLVFVHFLVVSHRYYSNSKSVM